MSVISIFVIVQIISGVLYAIQLLENNLQWTPLGRRQSARMLRVLPIGTFVVSACLVLIALRLNHSDASNCVADGDNIDPDIGGIGVVLGLTVPTIDLLVVLFVGHFKSEPSGAKELCVAQFANLVYLTVNLAKSTQTLSLREALVACSSLDAVSASISMAFSDKEVLAARKLVKYAHLAQMTALGVQTWSFSRIHHFRSVECSMHNSHPFVGNSSLLYIYIVIRLLGIITPARTLWRISKRFDSLQHEADKHIRVRDATLWAIHASTLTTSYLMFSSIAMLHTTILWSIIQGSSRKTWQTLWTEWGQSTSFILACYATIHVGYTFHKVCQDKAITRRSRITYEIHGHDRRYTIRKRKWSRLTRIDQSLPFGKHFLGSPDQVLLDTSAGQAYIELLSDSRQTHEEEAPFIRDEKKLAQNDLLKAFDPLHRDKDLIRDAIKRGAPLNEAYPEHNDDYPVHMAANWGSVDVVQETLPKEPDCSKALLSENADGLTPLIVSMRANNTDAFRYILQHLKQDDPNANHVVVEAFKTAIKDSKQQYLHILASEWSSPIILHHKLIDLALTKRFTRDLLLSGHPPSQLCLRAAFANQPHAIRHLLKSNPNDLTHHALDYALSRFHTDRKISTALESHGATYWQGFFNAIHAADVANLNSMIEHSKTDSSTKRMTNAYIGSKGQSALSILIDKDRKSTPEVSRCITLLLESGAQATRLDLDGESPLHKAAGGTLLPTLTFEKILDYTEEEEVSCTDHLGRTALHAACGHYYIRPDTLATWCALLDRGVDARVRDLGASLAGDVLSSRKGEERFSWEDHGGNVREVMGGFLERYEENQRQPDPIAGFEKEERQRWLREMVKRYEDEKQRHRDFLDS